MASVPLFSGVADADLDKVVNAARPVTFRKGARIFEEGAPADCCYVVTAGRLRVVVSGADGVEILLHIVTPPRLVGEVALLDRSTRSASLVAAEPSHLIRIPATALETLRRDAAFEGRLVASLVRTLREADDRVRVIASFPAISRVAWCLARIARFAGRREGNRIVVPSPPRQELGEMAGCTRETVSRAINALRRRKCLSEDGRSMRLDVEGMQRYLTTELLVPDDRREPQVTA